MKRCLLVLPLLLSGCVLSDTENPMAAPDINNMIVYFPLDGIVHGRARPGTLETGGDNAAHHIYVSARPSNSTTVRDVEGDGSFVFSIAASSSDVLEISGVAELNENDEAEERGTPAFVQVPPTPVFGTDFTCCVPPTGGEGTCQRIEEGDQCSFDNPAIVITCVTQGDCAHYSGQTINIPEDTFTINPPRADKLVVIEAKPARLPPLALVRVENRGQRAVGGKNPRFTTALITDEEGKFPPNFAIPASGDDEIVFRVFDINGFRSRQHSEFVPDAQLQYVDITGVNPIDPLAPGAARNVAVRFALTGIDGRGMCPDSAEGPPLCFSADTPADGFVGGLDFSAVQITSVTIDNIAQTPEMALKPATSGDTKFREVGSDILRPQQTIALIVDNSLESESSDIEDFRIPAAIMFAKSIRTQDRLGMWLSGGMNGPELYLEPTSNKDTIRAKLDEFQNDVVRPDWEMSGGDAQLLETIRDASGWLRSHSVGTASILVLTAAVPSNILGDYDGLIEELLVNLTSDDAGLRQAYPTYVVALVPQQQPVVMGSMVVQRPTLQDLETAATFSTGRYLRITTAEDFLQRTSEVMGLIAGAFNLVYALTLPESVGKSADLAIEATVTLQDPEGNPTSANARFEGKLRVAEGQ